MTEKFNCYNLSYVLLNIILLGYCFINAAYIVIIGGTSFYFFTVLILIMQSFLIIFIKRNLTFYSCFGLVALIILFIDMNGFKVENIHMSIALLPAFCLAVQKSSFIYTHMLRFKFLKITFICVLLLLAINQYYELNELKSYYATLHTGESWQQFGAL